MERLYLSPPDVGETERQLLLDAFDSNWIAPLGPHVDAFEREFAESVGVGDAAALTSGTAALHLGLLAAGVRPGDLVCADEAGIAFVPYARAAEVLEVCRKIDGADTRRKGDIDAGVPLAEILQRKYK